MASPIQTHPIPFIYRLCFNYIEPLMAFSGALQVHFSPESYLKIALPSLVYKPSDQPLFTQILGGWLIIAFHDAITLRVFSHDVRVWSFILGATLLSDLSYGYSFYQDVGLARLLNPLLWSGGDWVMMVTTLPPLVLKITFLAGLGLRGQRKQGKDD